MGLVALVTGLAVVIPVLALATASETTTNEVVGNRAASRPGWAEVSTFPQSSGGLGDVSCASSTCVAVGFIDNLSLAVSQDGGMSWANPPIPAKVSSLESVSCTSRLDCVAVGELLQPGPTDTRLGVVVATDDGGRSWARQSTPVVGTLGAVSCASTSHCVAVGNAGLNGVIAGSFVLVTANHGRTWPALRSRAASSS